MNAENYITQKYAQAITKLFKEFLIVIETMKQDHDYHYDKLYENIPEQYHPIINTANHFDATKLKWIRKSVLDLGNNALREFQTELENVTISFIFK